jgi:hypothetical protein
MFTVLQFGHYTAKARMQAMAEGVRALGGEVLDLLEGIDLTAVSTFVAHVKPRFAFTCGMHFRDAPQRGFLRGAGVPVLVLDCGYFRRASGGQDTTGYNQLGLDALCWTPPGALPADRWQAHGIALAPPVQGRGKVALILGQVPGDSQHNLSEIRLSAWLSEQAGRLIALGYTLLYRPHPAHVLTRLRAPHVRIDPVKESLADSLAAASLAVTYNSTSGLEALIAGVPVICAPTAHYAGLEPGTPALRAHCQRLAYTQWTCAELRTGAPLRFMQRFADLLPAAERISA